MEVEKAKTPFVDGLTIFARTWTVARLIETRKREILAYIARRKWDEDHEVIAVIC